jgi:dUTP diphosphatase
MIVKMKRVRNPMPGTEPLPPPLYMTSGAAAMDLMADVSSPVSILPLRSASIPTGIALEIPEGYEGQVRTRSGLAASHGVVCLNSPGTIDSDFRGEIVAIMINLGAEPFVVRPGDRIAQLAIARVERVTLVEVDGLSPSGRADGGLGSTGL